MLNATDLTAVELHEALVENGWTPLCELRGPDRPGENGVAMHWIRGPHRCIVHLIGRDLPLEQQEVERIYYAVLVRVGETVLVLPE